MVMPVRDQMQLAAAVRLHLASADTLAAKVMYAPTERERRDLSETLMLRLEDALASLRLMECNRPGAVFPDDDGKEAGNGGI